MQKHLSLTLRLWKLLKPFHLYIYTQIGLIFILQITSISFTLLFSKIIDSLISKNIHLLLIYICIFPVIVILVIISTYSSDKNDIKNLDSKIQQYLQEFSFRKIFNLNAFQYTENHSAVKLQVINRGEKAIQQIIQILTLQGLPVIFSIIISLVAISYYSISIGMWTMFTLVLLIYTTKKFTTYYNPLMRKDLDNWDTQNKVRTEAFNHLLLIKLSGQDEVYLKKYLAKQLAVITFSIWVWLQQITYLNGRNFFIYISRFVSLILVISLFLKGHTTVGSVYAIFSWTTDIYNNIRNINAILKTLPLRFIELEKYISIIDQTPAFEENHSTHFKSGDIVFDNVTFTYPKGKLPALQNVSFIVASGKKVAFVGHSGSGKSTITRLLLRMYNIENGTISIGTNDIHEINTKSLRHNIGYVEQHVDLFDDTIKENILFGVDERSYIKNEKQLEDIAHKTRIDQFYHRLGDKKFETIIGERGIKLSGGERQRVGIARAIIKNPEILIFDEATSSLDSENEKYVMDAINDVSQGKTTIIIAHRLSTVRNADKIIVMDGGHIVGEGTHAELMETCEVYQNLVAHQV